MKSKFLFSQMEIQIKVNCHYYHYHLWSLASTHLQTKQLNEPCFNYVNKPCANSKSYVVARKLDCESPCKNHVQNLNFFDLDEKNMDNLKKVKK